MDISSLGQQSRTNQGESSPKKQTLSKGDAFSALLNATRFGAGLENGANAILSKLISSTSKPMQNIGESTSVREHLAAEAERPAEDDSNRNEVDHTDKETSKAETARPNSETDQHSGDQEREDAPREREDAGESRNDQDRNRETESRDEKERDAGTDRDTDKDTSGSREPEEKSSSDTAETSADRDTETAKTAVKTEQGEVLLSLQKNADAQKGTGDNTAEIKKNAENSAEKAAASEAKNNKTIKADASLQAENAGNSRQASEKNTGQPTKKADPALQKNTEMSSTEKNASNKADQNTQGKVKIPGLQENSRRQNAENQNDQQKNGDSEARRQAADLAKNLPKEEKVRIEVENRGTSSSKRSTEPTRDMHSTARETEKSDLEAQIRKTSGETDKTGKTPTKTSGQATESPQAAAQKTSTTHQNQNLRQNQAQRAEQSGEVKAGKGRSFNLSASRSSSAHNTGTNNAGHDTATNASRALGKSEENGKTAESKQNARSQSAHNARLVEQIKVKVSKAAREGMDRIRIQLTPKKLGAIEVKLDMSEGRMKASITAARAETLDMLQKDGKVLERALADAGLDMDNDGLNFKFRGEEQKNAEKEEKRSRFAKALKDPDEEPFTESVQSTSLQTGDGTSGVNIRV